MQIDHLVARGAGLWGLDAAGWTVVVDGLNTTVRLPAARAALHVSRAGVTPARAEALHVARARLAADGQPVVGLIPSLAGRTWEPIGDRVLEVEHWMEHDGRMNTWERLRRGSAVLAAVHNSWADLDLGADADECPWANWVAPAQVAARSGAAVDMLERWQLPGLAREVERLARLTAVEIAPLPRQLVHGDFWDDNIYLRGEKIIAVTDFDFVGRRPRIDDLALMLYFADEQPYFDGSGYRSPEVRRSELTPLAAGYADGLAVPLSDAELAALPFALARQPMWTYAKWAVEHPDRDRAREDAVATADAVTRALQILDDPDPWSHAFAR